MRDETGNLKAGKTSVLLSGFRFHPSSLSTRDET
jgi:hypothetical protein